LASSEVPYGPPITDAIVRGDLAAMKELVIRAERHLAEHGDVKAMLELLKIEIARQSGALPGNSAEPDYGPPIQQAIARGDLAEMKTVLTRAETTLKRQGDLAAAVAQLRVEIARLEKK
jgi:hypothetical protein